MKLFNNLSKVHFSLISIRNTHTVITGFGFTAYKPEEKTSAEEKASLKEKQLVFNFNKAFPHVNLSSYERINKFLQMNVEGKKFLIEYNLSISGLLTMPKSFNEANVTLAEWSAISKAKEDRVKVLADTSQKILNVTKAYRVDTARINADSMRQLEKFCGLELVLSLTTSDLDLADQVKIASSLTVSDRKAVEASAIADKQRELIAYFRLHDGFPPGFSER
jgi:hypothetical protein